LHITAAENVSIDRGGVWIDASIDELRRPWSSALESALQDTNPTEVMA
jgi:hypothetical protein